MKINDKVRHKILGAQGIVYSIVDSESLVGNSFVNIQWEHDNKITLERNDAIEVIPENRFEVGDVVLWEHKYPDRIQAEILEKVGDSSYLVRPMNISVPDSRLEKNG